MAMQWDVTYHKNSNGEMLTVRVEGESWQDAISTASALMDESGWYFLRAIRV